MDLRVLCAGLLFTIPGLVFVIAALSRMRGADAATAKSMKSLAIAGGTFACVGLTLITIASLISH